MPKLWAKSQSESLLFRRIGGPTPKNLTREKSDCNTRWKKNLENFRIVLVFEVSPKRSVSYTEA